MNFYLFYCQKLWFYFYAGLLTLMCAFVFSVSMQDWIYLHKYRRLRGNMYVILGLLAALGAVHSILKDLFFTQAGDPYRYPTWDVLKWMLLMGATYIVGC